MDLKSQLKKQIQLDQDSIWFLCLLQNSTHSPYQVDLAYHHSYADFMELLTVVMESGGNVKRTPKLAKILATRACHKSVRAGDPLTHSKMVSVGVVIMIHCRL